MFSYPSVHIFGYQAYRFMIMMAVVTLIVSIFLAAPLPGPFLIVG